MFATTSRDKESIGICCIHRHAKLEMSDRERGIQFCKKKSNSLYGSCSFLLYRYITRIYASCLGVLNKSIKIFLSFIIYTHQTQMNITCTGLSFIEN